MSLRPGVLGFALVLSIYFIAFCAIAINEGSKNPVNDIGTNETLQIISSITLAASFVLIVLVPIYCVSQASGSNFETYGIGYTLLLGSVFMMSLSVIGLIGAKEHPNSVPINRALKIEGGIGIGVSLFVFLFCAVMLTRTVQT